MVDGSNPSAGNVMGVVFFLIDLDRKSDGNKGVDSTTDVRGRGIPVVNGLKGRNDGVELGCGFLNDLC